MRAVLVALAVLAARAAHAQPADPADLVARPLVLDPGAIVADLVIQNGLRGGPLALSPDLWYGVTPRLTAGVIHSNDAIDVIDARASLCLRGAAGSCPHAYRGSGLDVRWSWLDGPLAVAPRARFLLRDVDPWKPAVTLGALARWTRGGFAITGDPYLRLGVANRDLGNRAALFVPLYLEIQLHRGAAASGAGSAALALHTGWDGELATWRDGWHIPIAVQATLRATAQLDLGVSAGFPQLLGPQNNAKARAMSVTVEYRP